MSGFTRHLQNIANWATPDWAFTKPLQFEPDEHMGFTQFVDNVETEVCSFQRTFAVSPYHQEFMRLTLRSSNLLLSVLPILLAQGAVAADSPKLKQMTSGRVSNYEVFNQGRHKRDANVTFMQSEMALRISDVNRAIKLGRRAVELNPDDMEARTTLAEALYQKVKQGNTNDTGLFNECVKSWLMVLRNEVGEEKGMNYKGIGIPMIQKFYEDEDHGIIAKEKLTALVGRGPKMWETNKKFLDKVLKPETSVSGVIVKRQSDSGANNDETK